jgi:cytochrome c-type biogenesis protein CcmH
MRRALLAFMAIAILTAPAHAVQPNEILADPAKEARARALSLNLRCLVCQNQSIDDSDAPLARDLRLLVRERITAGDSDEAVMDYIVARYGEFVLLQPPFKPGTLILWLTPILVLIGGVWLARRASRGDGAPARELALSKDEQEKLDALLKKDA